MHLQNCLTFGVHIRMSMLIYNFLCFLSKQGDLCDWLVSCPCVENKLKINQRFCKKGLDKQARVCYNI